MWSTCTFQGLGPKKQAYLDLLNERMAKKGFQRVEKIGVKTNVTPIINKSSNLMFKSPDGLIWIGIRSLSTDEDLKVGYTNTYYNPKRTTLILASSMLLGLFFCYLSIFIIGHGTIPLSPNTPTRILLIPVLILLSVAIGTFYIIFTRPFSNWIRQLKTTLIETAESMGSKQITPFKYTTTELETAPAPRLYTVFKIVVIVFFLIALVLFISIL